MDAKHALLIDEPASVTRLLDAHLQLQNSTDAHQASVGRPVISRRAVRDRALANWSHRARHVAEVRGAIQVILTQISGEADAELLLASAERAGTGRRRWTRGCIKEIGPRLESDGRRTVHLVL